MILLESDIIIKRGSLEVIWEFLEGRTGLTRYDLLLMPSSEDDLRVYRVNNHDLEPVTGNMDFNITPLNFVIAENDD